MTACLLFTLLPVCFYVLASAAAQIFMMLTTMRMLNMSVLVVSAIWMNDEIRWSLKILDQIIYYLTWYWVIAFGVTTRKTISLVHECLKFFSLSAFHVIVVFHCTFWVNLSVTVAAVWIFKGDFIYWTVFHWFQWLITRGNVSRLATSMNMAINVKLLNLFSFSANMYTRHEPLSVGLLNLPMVGPNAIRWNNTAFLFCWKYKIFHSNFLLFRLVIWTCCRSQ